MELGRPDQEKYPQEPPRGAVAAAQGGQNHQPPQPQKCPRCDSSNTKFCYYNNYSLSQPRYFCKGCRRYWTQGGTLRNVPVGGGCRKSKRPKQPGPSSSSSGGEIVRRTQPLISQNLTVGMASSRHQSLIRALPPAMPSIGNSLYTGGGVLSSLGAIQSLPAGIMSKAPPSVNFGGSGGQFGANMALLQGLNLPAPLKSQAPPLQFPLQNELFPPQQSFNFPARPLSPWTHSFINRDQTSSSATPSFWSRSGGGDNQAGSSFAPNHWTDKTTGFDPSE